MTTTVDYGLARRMWHQLEPVHAMIWYAPEVFAEAATLGYDTSARCRRQGHRLWPGRPG